MKRNRNFKKGFVLGIAILFIFVSAIPSESRLVMENNYGEKTSFSSLEGNTLYVGGSGPNNYTKIQDAIDNASSGDAIFAYAESSPYLENLLIEKTIELIGENKDTTQISGINPDLPTIQISNTNDVVLSDFILSFYQPIQQNNIIVLQIKDSNYCIISNNSIYNTDSNIQLFVGLSLKNANSNTITKNGIYDNLYGLILFESNTNIIYMNQISDNMFGVEITGSTDNIVTQNNFFFGGVTFYQSRTQWDENYWNGARNLPKIIRGHLGWAGYSGIWKLLYFVPWINVDWHPAQEPYEIE